MIEMLIIAVIAGIGIAYFAFQNPITVPITIASYHFFNIPLFMLVTGSLLFGLLVAWIISLFGSLGNSFLFHKQNNRIEKDNQIIHDLENKIHNLEIENVRLKEQSPHTSSSPQKVTAYDHPSLLTRIRQSF
jgi:cell shape-determining protein MreC